MDNIVVYPNGVLCFNDKKYKCAIGKNGITKDKKEGDWATPVGCFAIRKIYYRADKIAKPESPFEIIDLTPDAGWCDDINDSNYNQFVKLPYAASHENLWREDNLYDIIVILGHNDNPPIPGKGSAIFMHIARTNFTPTAGCIALAQEDLLEILEACEKKTLVCIQERPKI